LIFFKNVEFAFSLGIVLQGLFLNQTISGIDIFKNALQRVIKMYKFQLS